MFTHQFFDLLLQLEGDWKVSEVDANYKGLDVIIRIEYIGDKAECPDTFETCSIYDHAPERVWRHLDTMQYKTYIACQLPRVKNSFGKVKTIVAPWASRYERHTYLFEHAAIDLLLATKNQTKTAKLMGCGFDVINRIIHTSSERGLARRNITEMQFEHLSIDEKSFKKGHKYVSVLSHPNSGCVIDVEDGRTKKSTEKLLDKALTKQQQQGVKAISMDMWNAYMTVSNEKLPNAEVVHDRFHLIQYLNKAIDQVRRREVKKHEELKHSRYALLKNYHNLTEKQRLKFEAIKKANYQVSQAWVIRQNFKDLFDQETKKENGFILFYNWIHNSIHKDRKSTRLNSSHSQQSRMPSSA